VPVQPKEILLPPIYRENSEQQRRKTQRLGAQATEYSRKWLVSEHRDCGVVDLFIDPIEIEYLPFLFLAFINSKTEEKYFV